LSLARQKIKKKNQEGGEEKGKPGSARLKGTPAMDLGLEGIRTYM